MTPTHFSITIEIPAPPERVWPVMADVERWPEWTPSVSRLVLLTPGLLQVGSRVRIHQPKLPAAFWRVTELNPGRNFAWISTAPGVRVKARHDVEATTAGSRVALSINYEGFLGALLARWTRKLNEEYLALEAKGLKARCTELAAKQARTWPQPRFRPSGTKPAKLRAEVTWPSCWRGLVRC